MRTLAVVWSVSVEASHEQHDRNGGVGTGILGGTNEEWDVLAIEGGTVGMGDDNFMDGGLPEGCSLHVDLLLAVEGVPFDVVFVVLASIVDVGEAGNAVDDCSATEVVGCFVWLAALQSFLGVLFKGGGHLEESVGVFICSCIVDVFLLY